MKSLDRQSYSVHPTACVDEPSSIGEGTRIWHFCHIMAGALIGGRCSLGQNVFVAAHVKIGDNVKIQNNVSLYEGVILEDDVFCGPSMVFTNVSTPRAGTPRNSSGDYEQTIVRRGATIGANATIVCGRVIGKHAFIGAGAVVTHDVPDFALVYGNPAKVVGYACECGIRLHFQEGGEASCSSCGRAYNLSNGSVVERISL